MEEGVFSSASTSLTPFFLPLRVGFLSLSLFWSFWLFSFFLLSDLGTQCKGSSDSTQLYTDVIRIPMILRCTLVQ